MKRILLLTIVFSFLSFPVFSQKTKKLTNADKTQIIRLVLEDGRIYKQYLFREEDSSLNISTENITRSLVPPKIGKTAILLKSPKEIENEKTRLSVYCAFGKFEIKNSTVNVSFYYYTKDPSNKDFNREVLEYKFLKVGKKWKFVSRAHPGLKIALLDN